MIEFGIIGCGGVVERQHIPAIEGLGHRAKVVAVADPSKERRDLIGEKLGIDAESRYADYREMLRERRLDVVDIAVPHAAHEEVVIAVAESGTHIISEKPLAPTMAEARRMIDAVEANVVRLAIIHNYVNQPQFVVFQNAINDGLIGRPFLIRNETLGGNYCPGAEAGTSDWRAQSAVGRGGCWLDNGYHQVYTSVALMGRPVEAVHARIGTFYHDIDVEDMAVVTLHHRDGGTTSITVGWCAPGGGQRVLEVHGDHGSLRFGGPGKLEYFSNETGERTPLEAPEDAPRSSFLPVFADFFEYLEKGLGSYPDARDALANLAVIEAAYESARTGQVVRVGK